MDAADFSRHLGQKPGEQASSWSPADDLTLEEMEVRAIRRALTLHEHNITAAAKALGITRSALYRRLEKFGIEHAP